MNSIDSFDILEDENPTGDETPGDTENPTGDETPGDTENPTGDEKPGETENPTGDEKPGETENPTGDEKPGEDETPTEGEKPGKDEIPTEGKTPTEDADPMQAILDGIRASLGEKDEDVDSLIESVRSLVNVMSMDQNQQRDVYIPPDIPIEGYKEWDYPITVDYLITIVGYADPVPQSQTYDDHEQFLEDFQGFAYECYKGVTFSGFSIDKVWGSDGRKLFDSQGMEEPEPEEPLEDLSPALLEALQSIDSRLEIIGTDLSMVSENSIAYYNDMRIMQEQNNTLQFHLLVTSIGLGFTVFLLLGYIVAHGFWQRMRVG